MGGAPKALAALCGCFERRWRRAATTEVITKAVSGLAGRMRCRLHRVWRARGKSAAKVIYLGLVLEGSDG